MRFWCSFLSTKYISSIGMFSWMRKTADKGDMRLFVMIFHCYVSPTQCGLTAAIMQSFVEGFFIVSCQCNAVRVFPTPVPHSGQILVVGYVNDTCFWDLHVKYHGNIFPRVIRYYLRADVIIMGLFILNFPQKRIIANPFSSTSIFKLHLEGACLME